MTEPDPRDAGGGWPYMDILLEEYAQLKDEEPGHPERRRIEITMTRQRKRILALDHR